jgi:hypothetical protein
MNDKDKAEYKRLRNLYQKELRDRKRKRAFTSRTSRQPKTTTPTPLHNASYPSVAEGLKEALGEAGKTALDSGSVGWKKAVPAGAGLGYCLRCGRYEMLNEHRVCNHCETPG